MNRELLARVRDRIAEVGNEHCDMLYYASAPTNDEGFTLVGDGEPSCGTTGCIAGHVVAMQFGALRYGGVGDWYVEGREVNVGTVAAGLLGLRPNEARVLFYRCHWPTHYREILNNEGDAKGMLAVCDALLDGALVFDADGELREAENV